MSIVKAAQELLNRLQGVRWLTAIGVGQEDQKECIFLYVKSLRQAKAETAFLTDGWQGFPVVIKQMGVPHLVSGNVFNLDIG
jgi:hypothetical protein